MKQQIFLGNMLLSKRVKAGLTTEEVAKMCDRRLRKIENKLEPAAHLGADQRWYPSPTTITRLERGYVCDPDPRFVKAFAWLFKCPVQDFYTEPHCQPIAQGKKWYRLYLQEHAGQYESVAKEYKLTSKRGLKEAQRKALQMRIELNERLSAQWTKTHGTHSSLLIPVYRSEQDLEPFDLVSKSIAHAPQNGFLHRTVIIIVEISKHLLYFTRGHHQTFGGSFDVLGGHAVGKSLKSFETPLQTARRELREEFHVCSGRDPVRLTLRPEFLREIPHNLKARKPVVEGREKILNVEISSVFLVRVPPHPRFTFHIFDEGASSNEVRALPENQTYIEPFRHVLRKFQNDELRFADGARRVFREYLEKSDFRKQLKGVFDL